MFFNAFSYQQIIFCLIVQILFDGLFVVSSYDIFWYTVHRYNSRIKPRPGTADQVQLERDCCSGITKSSSADCIPRCGLFTNLLFCQHDARSRHRPPRHPTLPSSSSSKNGTLKWGYEMGVWNSRVNLNFRDFRLIHATQKQNLFYPPTDSPKISPHSLSGPSRSFPRPLVGLSDKLDLPED